MMPLLMSLEGEKNPKAIGLFHLITNSLFLLVTALLIDVLTMIGILSLTFQKDSVELLLLGTASKVQLD